MTTTESQPQEASHRVAPVLVGDIRYQILQRFYFREAALLDDNSLLEWKELLDPELSYRMHVRADRIHDDPSDIPTGAFHLEDNHPSIALKIQRMTESSRAWSERPLTRTRRLVSNLLVDETTVPGVLAAATYLLVVRNFGDEPTYEFLSAKRDDLVVLGDPAASPRLLVREIAIDQLRIGVRNLGLFL